MEPLAVDVREAGRLLSVSPYTVRRMLRDGRLQSVRVGRRILVSVEGLIALVRRAQQPCAQQQPTQGSRDGET